MRVPAIVAALAPCALLAFSAAPASADGSWLDKKPLAQWNAAGAALPKAPHAQSDNLGRCGSELRKPETAVDHAVAAAGWKLFGPYQLFNGTALVMAQSDADGMCRPEGYQGFVFVNGTFAGTLAPKPMGSRTDGALEEPTLYASDSFTAEFLRYADSDPLCCASRTTSLGYKIKQMGGHPVVTPTEASTSKNS
jgi:hypothetical protein